MPTETPLGPRLHRFAEAMSAFNMSDKANQCTCSASFPTSGALNTHLNEIRLQEDFYSVQLEKCRTHSRASDDDSDDDNVCGDFCDSSPKSKVCPQTGCGRTRPFSTLQKLRRHFQQHSDVTCEEVCVFCFKLFRLASEFVRHVEGNHRDATGPKAVYMQTMRDELQDRVQRELNASQSSNVSAGAEGECRKRAWEAVGMDLETSRAQRMNGVGVGTMTTDDSQQINGAHQSLPSTQPATTFMLNVEKVATSSTIGNFDDVSTQFYSNLMGEPSTGDGYNAPLLQKISSIPYSEYGLDMGQKF